MSLAMMPTKLQKPHVPASVVMKEDVIQKLSRSSISVISAQAGSGKSTAVSYWLDHQDLTYIWYALDEWDQNLAQFLVYVSSGLKSIDEHVSSQIEQLLSARQSISDEMLIKSTVTLLNRVQKPFVWVLDDYHTVHADDIHQFMNALLNHFPSTMKVCILSREDPPFPMAKLRSQKLLTEVRVSDLRFTLEEAAFFVNRNLDHPITRKQIESLYAKTEGWIAGLQLAVLSMQGVEDVQTFILEFSESHYYIMDYLLEEVLERHGEALRQFMLKTSVFEYFSAELCDDVLSFEAGESQKYIEALLKKNSFLIKLNQHSIQNAHATQPITWYRYHHLFRELLKSKIKEADLPNISHLHKRAGMWFEDRQQMVEAIQHFLSGEHYTLAASLLEHKWSKMNFELMSSTWMDMARRLPKEIIDRSPVILMGIGWAHLDLGDIVNCKPYFALAQERYDQWLLNPESEALLVFDVDELKQLPVSLMRADVYIAAIFGDYDVVMEKTVHLVELSKQHDDQFLWVNESFVAIYYWGRGDLDSAITHMQQLTKTIEGKVNPIVEQSLIWVLAELYVQKGELSHAKGLIEKAIEENQKDGTVPILMATFYLYLAMIETFRGNRHIAHERLKTSETYGQQYDYTGWRHKYESLKARLYMLENQRTFAYEAIENGVKHEYKNLMPETLIIDDMAFYYKLKYEEEERNLIDQIEMILRTLKPFSVDGISYSDEMKWKLVLRFAPMHRYGARLEKVCRDLLKRSEYQRRWLHVIEYTVLLMRFTPNELKRLELYQRAKELSAEEGIVLPFDEFLETKPDQKISESKVGLLTQRELDILTLIEAGLSNQEIASRLYIALSTVKSYNNTLFEKLEVKRRTEAIVKAKKMGLL